jgi:UDP-N-acetylglucosamine diphosphorylase / glucose-1-phosphate thymidylyltransferase / UDP-N-acetylgalactosamine diphosphorylase / glucosamine-1-phosphate N-acetyltransferase / galactosamine-1-phosphate N-acetyltransferase
MKLILFDDGAADLAPLDDLRPVFDIRTGAWSALERWADIGIPPAGLLVPQPRAEIARALHPKLSINQHPPAGAVIVNGRWPLSAKESERIAALEPGQALACGPTLLAVRVGDEGFDPKAFDLHHAQQFEASLLERCWHVRTLRDQNISYDLSRMAPAKGVVVREGARVAESAVLDASGGAIVVAKDARVGHHAVIFGPAYIGPGATVIEHATIRPNTAIGPVCKVGGEITGVIFQGHANKAHEGFLGDSYIGMWVNLGAGTTNSNLLNTYGQVVIDRQRTGETFMGCVLGDHVRTAIGTRIMTGAVVGTGTMWAASRPVTGRIGPMRWVTDAGERAYRPEKFLEVARAAMARRDHEPSKAEQDRFQELGAATAGHP